MRRGQRGRAVTVLLSVVMSVILAPVGDTPARAAEDAWTGAETLTAISVGPNLARCGVFPRHLEARLSGAGVDTNGGSYVVVASGCLDTREDVLFGLEARDTYVRTGESIVIVPDDVPLAVDPATCVGTNARPAGFDVEGGTGRYAGVDGGGTFTLVMTMPTCAGPQAPAQLWFTGSLTNVG
jgi:hypothetical protein